MPRTKKTAAAPTEPIPVETETAIAQVESQVDEEKAVIEEEEDILDEDDYDDDDDEDEDDESPVLRGMFELLTNDAGQNLAQILTSLTEAIDKQNKILYKIMSSLPSKN